MLDSFLILPIVIHCLVDFNTILDLLNSELTSASRSDGIAMPLVLAKKDNKKYILTAQLTIKKTGKQGSNDAVTFCTGFPNLCKRKLLILAYAYKFYHIYVQCI